MKRKGAYYEELLSTKIGRIKVQRLIRIEPKVGRFWECICECGKTFEASTSALNKRKECPACAATRRKEESIKQLTTHGKSKEYLHKVWISMRRRCTCKTDTDYKYYGARGISVCPEWDKDYLAFREWAIASGFEEGKGLTIDRIDCKGNYTPENCRWLTMREQAKNRRTTHWLTINGETLCVKDWAKRIGKSPSSIHRIIKKGASPEEYIAGKLKEASYD